MIVILFLSNTWGYNREKYSNRISFRDPIQLDPVFRIIELVFKRSKTSFLFLSERKDRGFEWISYGSSRDENRPDRIRDRSKTRKGLRIIRTLVPFFCERRKYGQKPFLRYEVLLRSAEGLFTRYIFIFIILFSGDLVFLLYQRLIYFLVIRIPILLILI